MREYIGTEQERRRWRDEKRRERATMREADAAARAEQDRIETEHRRRSADLARRAVLADAVCRKCEAPLLFRPDAYRRQRASGKYPLVVASRCGGCGAWSHVAGTRHDAGEPVAWELRSCKTAYLFARMADRIAKRKWKRDLRRDAADAARGERRRATPDMRTARQASMNNTPASPTKTPAAPRSPPAARPAVDTWFAVRY